MNDILIRYPFLLPLIGTMVIELSAILLRRTAQILGGWFWYLAGALSCLGAGTLTWSLIWANTPDTIALPRGGFINFTIGPLLILSGIVWVSRSFLALGRQALLPWPPTRVVYLPPYRSRRRPMALGMAMLAAGVALTTVRVEGWIWFGVWLLLSQPLLELEDWELRSRLSDAATYLDRTPRYFKLPRW
jgi:hypothetical protein